MADAPVPITENSAAAFGLRVRRLVLLDRARAALGGTERLAAVLGIGRRAVTYKLAAERGLTDAELCCVAKAVEAERDRLGTLANDLLALTA